MTHQLHRHTRRHAGTSKIGCQRVTQCMKINNAALNIRRSDTSRSQIGPEFFHRREQMSKHQLVIGIPTQRTQLSRKVIANDQIRPGFVFTGGSTNANKRLRSVEMNITPQKAIQLPTTQPSECSGQINHLAITTRNQQPGQLIIGKCTPDALLLPSRLTFFH
ncbi:MAG TPA: hypothetical protein VGG19_18045 [Tepidisphaeraceae bacterium]